MARHATLMAAGGAPPDDLEDHSMRALSAIFGVVAIDTAAAASAEARAKSRARLVDLPMPPSRPGAWARWAAQREPDGIRSRDERRSAVRTGIAQRRA